MSAKGQDCSWPFLFEEIGEVQAGRITPQLAGEPVARKGRTCARS